MTKPQEDSSVGELDSPYIDSELEKEQDFGNVPPQQIVSPFLEADLLSETLLDVDETGSAVALESPKKFNEGEFDEEEVPDAPEYDSRLDREEEPELEEVDQENSLNETFSDDSKQDEFDADLVEIEVDDVENDIDDTVFENEDDHDAVESDDWVNFDNQTLAREAVYLEDNEAAPPSGTTSSWNRIKHLPSHYAIGKTLARVPDTEIAPFRYICLISANVGTTKNKKTEHSTGFIVGPRHVLTTAHSLVDSGSFVAPVTISVLAGLNGDDLIAENSVKKIFVKKGFLPGHEVTENDYALLELENSFSTNPGVWGRTADSNDDRGSIVGWIPRWRSGFRANVSGYPFRPPPDRDDLQFHSYDMTVKQNSTHAKFLPASHKSAFERNKLIVIRHAVEPGMSGSPIWVTRHRGMGGRFAVAIVLGILELTNRHRVFVARTIDSSVRKFIESVTKLKLRTSQKPSKEIHELDEFEEEYFDGDFENEPFDTTWHDENVEPEVPRDYDAFDDQLLQNEIKVSNQPRPEMFYRIRKGDNLLKIAGQAFQVRPGPRRLLFAKYINGHPLNHRYYVQSKKTFTKKHFSEGIISFLPKFSCDVKKLLASTEPPRGKCFAVIWIPNNRSNYHPFLGKGRTRRILKTEIEEEEEASKVQIISRKRVTFDNVKKIPHRWICALQLAYEDPDDKKKLLHFLGTGFLVDGNYILTAAHNLFNVIKGSKKTPEPKQVLNITVAPGANGFRSTDFIFGVYEIKDVAGNIAIPGQWRSRVKHFQNLPIEPFRKKVFNIAPDKNTGRFDYGLIKLPTNIGDKTFKKISGERLGYWGDEKNSQIRPINPKHTIKDDVNICGYDVVLDKTERHEEGFLQFKAIVKVNSIDEGSRDLIKYSVHNTESGMSGSPAWVEHASGKQPKLQLVGIHGHREYGVLLTSEVLKDIKRFKIQLGS